MLSPRSHRCKPSPKAEYHGGPLRRKLSPPHKPFLLTTDSLIGWRDAPARRCGSWEWSRRRARSPSTGKSLQALIRDGIVTPALQAELPDDLIWERSARGPAGGVRGKPSPARLLTSSAPGMRRRTMSQTPVPE
jgi:hypothetical protein